MKIAAKLSVTALATVLVLGTAFPHLVRAQASLAGIAEAPAAHPASATATPAATTPKASESSQVKEVLDSIKIPSADGASYSPKKGASKTDLAEDGKTDPSKVPDSVKKVVKSLNEATEDVTLDSLNSAREAVVKLDVLIDIEKRLNDLAKIRKDRADKEDLANAMPSMAFQQPISSPPSLISPPPAMNQPTGVMPVGMAVSSGQVEVIRVLGASGRYSAQVKDFDGQTKLIHVGDKMSDGAVVNSISREGVTFTGHDKKSKTVQVKDIGTVFGGR